MDIFDLSGILSYGFYRKIAILEGSPWHPRMGPNRSRSPTVPPGDRGKNQIAHVTLRWQPNKTLKRHFFIRPMV